MSTIQCRLVIAAAVAMFAMATASPAHAQFIADPAQRRFGQPSFPNNGSGRNYDIANQAMAEHKLGASQARRQRFLERGNTAGADREAWKSYNYQYRIAVDEWLIRKNSGCDPGRYPYPVTLDPMSCAVIGQYRRPPVGLDPR